MGKRFDRRLIDPTPAAVREALTKARAAADARKKDGALPLSERVIGTVCDRVKREPEGVYHPSGYPTGNDAAKLVIAWRTDAAGRKHVRVRGWRQKERRREWWDPEAERDRRELSGQPPLWFVDPEWVYEREADGERLWVCGCRCGAVGTPETLGWSAGMCGPCSDRVQELGDRAASVAPAPWLVDEGFTPHDVGFTPEGHVTARGWGLSRTWDLATGKVTAKRAVVQAPPDYNRPISVLSRDGRKAVHTFPDGGEAVVYDLTRPGDPGGLVRQFVLGRGAANRTGNWTAGRKLARFTPDGERVLFAHGQELELWRLDRDRAVTQATFPAPIVGLEFTPDYERLLVLDAEGWVNVCHPGLLTYVKARFRWHVARPTGMALSADGRTLVTAGPEGVKVWQLDRLLEGL